MTTREVIESQFKKLLEEGRTILAACGWDGKEMYRWPSEAEYLRFRTQAMNLVRRACGEDSDHYKELCRLTNDQNASNNPYFFPHCLGIVQAAAHDFEAGLLFDLRRLVMAEVLGDFLEQAELLLSEGYYVPSASSAGAVLEDGLRKLWKKHKLPIPEKTTIDRLNADLARASVYDKLIQKRITALADIRNNADHGHFDKFKQEDVDDMVKWVRRFTADYLR